MLAVVTLARRIAAGPRRALWIALAAAIVLAGPLLVARFDIPTSWVSAYVARRFHVLPLLLLAIPIAVGLRNRSPSRVKACCRRSSRAARCLRCSR